MKVSEHSYNKFSQFGEDGIIARIFEIIGIGSKVCVEFGAWDGYYLSNTANLWTNGWKGILIEADASRFDGLVKNTRDFGCACIHAHVAATGPASLERILNDEGLLTPVDVLSIDVDGDDYYIFEGLRELRPRLVICEFNPTIPIHMELRAEYGNYFGCSALSLVKLAESKAYRLVAMTDTNAFFVEEQNFPMFSEYETSLQAIAPTAQLAFLITSYDGKYVLSREPVYGCTGPYRQQLYGDYSVFPESSNDINTSRVGRLRRKGHRAFQRARNWLTSE